jgi:hypothetical protein
MSARTLMHYVFVYGATGDGGAPATKDCTLLLKKIIYATILKTFSTLIVRRVNRRER